MPSAIENAVVEVLPFDWISDGVDWDVDTDIARIRIRQIPGKQDTLVELPLTELRDGRDWRAMVHVRVRRAIREMICPSTTSSSETR